jgi:hypothetical protein
LIRTRVSSSAVRTAYRCGRNTYHGDDFTDEDVDRLRRQPRRPESVAFAAALREQMENSVHCVPGIALDVTHHTTVGLGDTFVGGFLAALAQNCR